jgi:hypothetical protein
MPKILLTIICLILVVWLGVLSFFVYRLRLTTDQLSAQIAQSEKATAFQDLFPQKEPSQTSPPTELQPTSYSQAIDSLKEYFAQSIATLAAAPAPIEKITYLPQTSPSKQTSYITMGDNYTTTSTDWKSIPGSDVYIDLANDYSPDAQVSWSASLKVAHGNGQAFARLYDATNNIAVIGSEITTINNADYQQVTSAGLALWRGKNLYRVQVKSLNSFEIGFSGGKLKIVY